MSQTQKKGSILVVDDDESVREVIACGLSDAGYQVSQAKDGQQALSLVARHRFDMMFLDIKMPGMSGLDVLKLVRLTRPDLPVVMLTAMPDESYQKETAHYDAVAYIVKPCDVAEVVALADGIVAWSGLDESTQADKNNNSVESSRQDIMAGEGDETGEFATSCKSSMNILVVDDEEAVRELLSQALEAEGYKVDTAGDGLEALEKVGQREYALVFLDIRMPRMNGLDVLAQITRKQPSAMVVMLTAVTEASPQVKANRNEAFAYLTKPCSLEEVTNVANKVCESR